MKTILETVYITLLGTGILGFLLFGAFCLIKLAIDAFKEDKLTDLEKFLLASFLIFIALAFLGGFFGIIYLGVYGDK